MDLNQIKRKLNDLQSSNQKGKNKEKIDYTAVFWKPKSEGKYQIRIVPSKSDSTNPFKEVYIHYGFSKFPIYALTNWGEKDPIVEFTKSLKNTNDRDNWKLANKISPKMRVFAPVVVRGEEDRGVRLWEFGKEIYMQLLGLAEDEDYGDFTDVTNGFDFTLEAVMGDVGGRQGLKSSIRPKRKTSPLSTDANQVEEWLEKQPDILSIQETYKKSFDDLKNILQDWLEPNKEETEDEIEEQEEIAVVADKLEVPKSNYSLSSKPVKKSKADQFDDLFEDEE